MRRRNRESRPALLGRSELQGNRASKEADDSNVTSSPSPFSSPTSSSCISSSAASSSVSRVFFFLFICFIFVVPSSCSSISSSLSFQYLGAVADENNKNITEVIDSLLPSSSSSSGSNSPSTSWSPFLSTTEIIIAVCPKSLDNPFFDPVHAGCLDAAAKISKVKGVNVTCLWIGSAKQDALNQSTLLLEFIRARAIHGLAVSVIDLDSGTQVINEAVDAGIPVVTFDSDAPLSKRTSYIGTQQYAFGYQLGNLVKQLLPEGGTYALISAPAFPNIFERHIGLQQSLKEPTTNRVGVRPWIEVPGSPADSLGSPVRSLMDAELFANRTHPTAIISVLGAPMRTGQGWAEFTERYPNITFLIADAMPMQLEMLQRSAVNGLLGQQPYEMGYFAINTLYDLALQKMQVANTSSSPSATAAAPPPLQSPPEIIQTAFVQHLMVPLQLPRVTVDRNFLGNLRYVGIGLFCIVATTAISFAFWAYKHRKESVVRVSQPLFLIMHAIGVFLTSCALLPLSFDVDDGAIKTAAQEAQDVIAKAMDGLWRESYITTDNDDNANNNYWKGTAVCMSFQWLFFIGFTTTFSALFAKIYRVNRIFRAKQSFRRFEVTQKQFLVPFLILLTANFSLLLTWTMVDPLTYRRMNHPGTDAWDRVISTYGACVPSSGSLRYLYFLVPLAIVNLGILAVANWQAYEARGIEVEFSESKWIALAMASMFQACVVGLPLLFVVRDQPQAFYLLLVSLLFVILMTILLVIFVPKIHLFEELKHQSAMEQQRAIHESIRRSSSFNLSGGSAMNYSGTNLRSNNSSTSNLSNFSNGSNSRDGGKIIFRRRDGTILSTEDVEDEFHAWVRGRQASNAIDSESLSKNYTTTTGRNRRKRNHSAGSGRRIRDEKNHASLESIHEMSCDDSDDDDDDDDGEASCDGEIEFHPNTDPEAEEGEIQIATIFVANGGCDDCTGDASVEKDHGKINLNDKSNCNITETNSSGDLSTEEEGDSY